MKIQRYFSCNLIAKLDQKLSRFGKQVIRQFVDRYRDGKATIFL